MALLALIVSGFSESGWLAVFLLGLIHITVVFCYSRFFVGDRLIPRYLWLLPLRDCLAFGTWALSFLGNRVTWRGNNFRLLPGGKIVEIDK
jgi:ceramide glucosyltransferase